MSLQIKTMCQYYSQWKQDQWLNENVFKHKENGFFVDVGAYDGVCGNNSLFFEETLHWNGICIEPIPEIFEKLRLKRKCAVVKGCAYDTDGILTFNHVKGYAEMLSGVNESYNEKHRERIQTDINHQGGEQTFIECDSYRLETLFDSYGVTRVNYLSIDTEGSEMNVLKGINFEKVKIDVIDVEVNYPEDEKHINDFLTGKGYRFAVKLGGDMVYVSL